MVLSFTLRSTVLTVWYAPTRQQPMTILLRPQVWAVPLSASSGSRCCAEVPVGQYQIRIPSYGCPGSRSCTELEYGGTRDIRVRRAGRRRARTALRLVPQVRMLLRDVRY
eukprot:2834085-Rhodomonas_salina.2